MRPMAKKPPVGMIMMSSGFAGRIWKPQSDPLPEKFPEHAEQHQGKQKAQSHADAVNEGRQQLVLAREHLRAGKDDGKGDDEHDIEAHFLVHRSLGMPPSPDRSR